MDPDTRTPYTTRNNSKPRLRIHWINPMPLRTDCMIRKIEHRKTNDTQRIQAQNSSVTVRYRYQRPTPPSLDLSIHRYRCESNQSGSVSALLPFTLMFHVSSLPLLLYESLSLFSFWFSFMRMSEYRSESHLVRIYSRTNLINFIKFSQLHHRFDVMQRCKS